MMLSGEPAIHRVPGPWVVLVFGFRFLVFGFWFLVFGFWFLVFGFWALLGRPNIGSKDLYFVSSFQSVKPFSSQRKVQSFGKSRQSLRPYVAA